MARVTAKGLFVWDQTTDSFNHTQLAANWDLIDGLLDAIKNVQILAAVPGTGNFAGRLVMLNAADSGFAAWTLIRYDGSAWKAVAGVELLPAVPSSGNFAGRVVILSAANGGFNAYDVIRYNGSTWSIIGGFASVNTGGGAGNIAGLETTGDVSINSIARGLVLKDRTTTTQYRIYVTGGALAMEVVT